MGFKGAGFEFRVELSTNHERMVCYFQYFYQITLGINPSYSQAFFFQFIAVLVIDFIAMSMAF